MIDRRWLLEIFLPVCRLSPFFQYRGKYFKNLHFSLEISRSNPLLGKIDRSPQLISSRCGSERNIRLKGMFFRYTSSIFRCEEEGFAWPG